MHTRTPSGEAVWNSPEWLADATRWIDEVLRGTGRVRLVAPQRWRVVRWSALLTVETDRGRVWMKAPRPECAIEVALYGLFARALPGLVTPLAVDAQRGWMLLADAGERLSESGDGAVVLRVAEAALLRYAEVQRALASHVDELLARGGADLRPASLGAVLDRVCEVALTDLEEAGDPDRLVRHVHAARARSGEVDSWGAQLAAAAPGPSVDHGDLHLSNVLVGGHGPVLIDWGDATVGHPFASLRVMLDAARGALATGREDRRLARLRDAYLDAFTDLASLDELREIAALATRVAPIHRAVAIQRAVRSLPGEAPPDPHWARFVARELADLGAAHGS